MGDDPVLRGTPEGDTGEPAIHPLWPSRGKVANRYQNETWRNAKNRRLTRSGTVLLPSLIAWLKGRPDPTGPLRPESEYSFSSWPRGADARGARCRRRAISDSEHSMWAAL